MADKQAKTTTVNQVQQFLSEAPQEALLESYKNKLDPSLRVPSHIYSKWDLESKQGLAQFSNKDRQEIVSFITGSTHGTPKQDQPQSPSVKAYETEIQPDPDYGTEVISAFAAQMSQMSSNPQDILQVHRAKSNQSKSRPPPSNSSNSSFNNTSNQSSNSKPTRASLSNAHPAVLMFDTDNTTYEAKTAHVDYQVFQHHMCYHDDAIELPTDDEILTYSVSKQEIKPEDALIDRGANGSLIGDDTRKIASPAVPKFVNASGITPHQLTNIPIITAGAYCETQRGGVILIFHEAAYKGSGNSILSAIQMEAYCNKVDEKASGLGST